uniref:Coronin n=1 Tax=Cynoglossus semilaevis TaxID=244447 RepID=A0A3P8V8X4_CYNSE
MSWRSLSRGSKFRHVFGKPASRDHSYDNVPITHSVHDNHHCSANPCFIAVITECSGGGAFLVLPIRHTGRVDPHQPRVCGHSGRVLDIKWNPFDDYCIASCSEDCTVKIWDIPVTGVQQNLTRARKTLIGHSRRVGLIEWHPTAENLLLSSAYDYKVFLWDISQMGSIIRFPVRVVLMPFYHRYPPETLLLSVSFNSDGSRLAVTSKDRRIRVLDPRTGKILQDDLSEPVYEEDLDGSAGVLFPFYDPDTHMLYLAGKGDGNIRYYELSAEKPYISFLTEFRSSLPQKGLGVMPKRGLDVATCEVFRFYRLIVVKDLVEPLSMIVPRKEPGIFQEDLYPMTAGNQAAMTAQEWLSGTNRGPLLISLKPESQVANPYPETPAEKGQLRQLSNRQVQKVPGTVTMTGTRLDFIEQAFLEEQLAYQDAKYPRVVSDLSGWQPDETQIPPWIYCCTPHCCEPAERPPPTAENELLQAFYRQQDEIRGLKEQLNQKEVRIARLEREIKNNRNSVSATF